MSSVKLAELIQIAGDIARLKEMIDTEENPREWKKVKEAIPAMEERFKKARNAYVDTVLMNDDGEDPVDGMNRELEDFRSKDHISWRQETDYNADNLVSFITPEEIRVGNKCVSTGKK